MNPGLELQRLLGPMARKVALMVGRAVVRLVDDSPQMQTLQVELLQGELRSDVERLQNYGFTSVPLPGAEAAAVSVAGSRDHVLVVAVDDRRYRLTGLQAGEVAIYTDQGDKVVIKRGGEIEVTASTKVRLITPLVEMTGNLTVAGTVVASGDVTGQGTSLHTHRHSGVTSGGSNTGAPV